MEKRYNQIRVIGMSKPSPLREIYVRANILQKITNRQSMTVDELEKTYDKDRRSFDKAHRNLSPLQLADDLDKFIILGQPEAGKSTFLKHLTLHYLDVKTKKKRIPVFISLKDFADENTFEETKQDYLLQAIVEEFEICKIKNSEAMIKRILDKGKMIVLLDGLDEVDSEKKDEVIREIIYFSTKYENNQFVISCRLAGYNQWFHDFKDVEIAEFNRDQIQTFVENWFRKEQKVGIDCLTKIDQSLQISELATNPIVRFKFKL